MKKNAKIALTLDEAMRRDLVLFNNPVLIQGLALTPVVAATSTLKNAVILSLVAFILIVPTRVVGDLLVGYVPRNLRMMIYALTAAVCYMPALLVVTAIFGTDVAAVGSFVPMMVVDGIVLSRAEIQAREGPLRALRNGALTALGLSLVMLGVGLIRELMGSGRIWGQQVLPGGYIPIAATVAGGFILVALLSALVQWISVLHKRLQMGGREE
jgi:electron transport complex protein RnfE